MTTVRRVTTEDEVRACPPLADPRRYRRTKLVTATALLLLLLAPAVMARLFVWPQTDRPGRVDAVVVLSGDYGERMRRALELMGDGAALTLVHAGEPDSQQVVELCRDGADFEVVCPRPEPDSTRAEAKAVADLARSRGWSSIAVVTSNFHVTRAGILFRRCFEGEVKMVGAASSFSRDILRKQITHEAAGVLELLGRSRGC